MRVLNFGSINIDHIYAVDHIVTPGETISASSVSYAAGGKGLNQSIALAKSGISAFHAGCIGADGQEMRTLLEENKVSTKYLKNTDVVTGHAIIQVAKDGQNSIIIHGGANLAITTEQIQETLSHFTSEDGVLLQNEISHIREIAIACKSKNIPVYFNPSPITEDLLKNFPFEAVSVLLINETEGQNMTEKVSPEDITSTLLSQYPDMQVVLTLGSKGVLFASKRENVFQQAYHVTAVDTTAAGDTFAGFFLGALLQGKGVRFSLQCGCAAAALAVTVPGAAPSIPSQEQVNQFMAAHQP